MEDNIQNKPTPPGKQRKDWTELKGENSWTMFKVIAEFVESFERLNKIEPCVSVFGSARTKPDNKYYQMAVDVSKRLSEEGYGIITGGGPGIMEAGNKGASEVPNTSSVGLNIELPMEQGHNPYIDIDKVFNFNYFFVRKVMFVKYAQAFVVLPGGFGTLDELFEVMTLIQTRKIEQVPVILMGKEYWSGLLAWINETMLNQFKNVSPADIDLFTVTDDVEEVVKLINEFYTKDKHTLRPNWTMS